MQKLYYRDCKEQTLPDKEIYGQIDSYYVLMKTITVKSINRDNASHYILKSLPQMTAQRPMLCSRKKLNP